VTYPPPGNPDPYGQPQQPQQPSQDPFASPPPPTYGQPPAAPQNPYDPYAQQPPVAPQSPAYGQQSPAAPQNPYDPYAQQQSAPPQYGQPYAQQYPAYGPPASTKTNGMAIAALCTGIGGIVLCFCYGLGLIPGALGVIFGFLGMRQTAERGENGRGMAIAGLITGGIGVLLSIGFWILFAIGVSMNPSSFE
jgi:hypothetical protein